MRIAAIYRAYYGSDFIEASLASIYDHVSRIYVFTANKPFGGAKAVRYHRREIYFPHDVDGIEARVDAWAIANDHERKIRILPNPFESILVGQIGAMVKSQRIAEAGCDHVLLVETDEVWPETALSFLIDQAEKHPEEVEWSAESINFWRSPRFAFRRSSGPHAVLRNITSGIEATNFALSTGRPIIVPGGVCLQNFGYASSARTIFWKHMAALSFSRDMGMDSPPREEWFDDVWRPWNWNTNRRFDICPSVGAPGAFSQPMEFDKELLVPEVAKMVPLPEWAEAEA